MVPPLMRYRGRGSRRSYPESGLPSAAIYAEPPIFYGEFTQ
ncbi:hypothetical protein GLA29479_1457 [Lysobacter antibioticus]|uniref:Uncharacterized protein n=1 Tax=Lysobacter antibioticus TaxID=84531 RepID=A0A0S2F9H5_LYSAN|nr:hypothetical protein GLA29479_1457 [Lysobacter antibioticus]ALN80188.1 hypothetical protein LA76x_2048 [Lysobacter antibioticus]